MRTILGSGVGGTPGRVLEVALPTKIGAGTPSPASSRPRIGPPEIAAKIHAVIHADTHAFSTQRHAVSLAAAGEAGSQSSKAIDHALPGDALASRVRDPADLTRPVTLSGQEGHLPVGHQAAPGNGADDGEDSGPEGIAAQRVRRSSGAAGCGPAGAPRAQPGSPREACSPGGRRSGRAGSPAVPPSPPRRRPAPRRRRRPPLPRPRPRTAPARSRTGEGRASRCLRP